MHNAIIVTTIIIMIIIIITVFNAVRKRYVYICHRKKFTHLKDKTNSRKNRKIRQKSTLPKQNAFLKKKRKKKERKRRRTQKQIEGDVHIEGLKPEPFI